MVDKTSVRRDIERHANSSSRIDIEVESSDPEAARNLAGRLAEAIHDEIRAIEDDDQ